MTICARQLWPWYLAAFLVVCVVPSAFADVLFTYGFSPRGVGLGGAMSATADDFGASYYNPAGTVFQPRPNFGLGYLVTGSQLNGLGIDAPDLDRTQGLLLGLSFPLPLGGFLHERLAFGLASFFPNGLLLGICVPYPEEPQYVVLQNSGRSLTLIPTLSIKLMRGWSIGGGAQIFDNTTGEFNAVVKANGAVDATVGEELTASYAATFGMMFRPGEYWTVLDGLRIGLVFRDKFYTYYDIPVSSYISSVPLAVYFSAFSIYTPRQWVVAAAYTRRRWLWEVDASFNEWSDFPDPTLKVDVQLKIPVLPVTFRNSKRYAPHFHDTFTVRAGSEVLAYDGRDLDLFLRGGYSFDPSPVPPQTGDTNYLDTDRHIGGCSLGLQWSGVGDFRFETPFAFDAAFQAQYLTERRAYKKEDVDADNPGYPSIGFSGWLYAVLATVGTHFDFE